ncbi:hypothetical protein Val02_28610 [Virgisporangium aliadipatigenens]|uniref:Peptidase C14 caspase domain-containing protein n=1 Tax=Virgisporangium aliadipatigenens TaxID=741659 RepID=A0A8J3YL96_9ACTN|nr:caspase family protein [Virgisporangium aliadipatigenens]GIJ45975.1 hypothetical protein Val02_28610 [Virgisporangium aliadipatigenens]
MARRALLIGSATGGLTGVARDIESMGELLDGRGFEIRELTGANATRAGILDGYEKLIADCASPDTAFVYYSGHGGIVRPLATDAATPAGDIPRDLQFIVPTDIEASTPADFLGILDTELAVLLARLLERTENAVVMLDCCHAAHMARDPQLRPRALPRLSYLDLADNLERRRKAGLQVDLLPALGNRGVRLVACAPEQSAYEYPNRDGVTAGIFTEAFRAALSEAGTAPVTWSTLMRRIRDRTLTLAPEQRPEVEGNSARLLFEVETAERTDAVPIAWVAGTRASIPGAALLGIGAGDRFAVMPAGAVRVDDATTIAVATVAAARGAAAEAILEFRPGHAAVPIGAQAHPLSAAARRRPVASGGTGPFAERLRAALAAAPTLRPAGPDDGVLLADVEFTGDAAVIRDAAGPLTRPVPADDAGIGQLVTMLGRLARSATLRELAPAPDEVLDEEFGVEWGRVVDGAAVPMTPSGALVHAGDAVYVRLRNDSDRRLYFFVFDLGVSGVIDLLTQDDPSGLRIDPGREYVLGARDGVLEGSAVSWPAAVPAGAARPEALLVLVTAARQELAVLQQEGITDAGSAKRFEEIRRDGSALERALADIVLGGEREVARARGRPVVRYAAQRVEFLLSPLPRPTPEVATFLVDERPERSIRLLGARDAAPATPVAIRLRELVVHRNRAWGGSDIRVDALIVTGGGDGDVPVYRAGTARFGNVRDGDRLPLDNLLVYHGPAVGYLDLAWWVSRDRTASRALGDLLAERLNAAEFTAAAAQLAGLAVAAPQAAAAVAAVGAAAIVVNTAYRLLSEAVGDSIGIYRTSFLAGEDFGIGRHPRDGLLRAQDFSYSYEIVGVG